MKKTNVFWLYFACIALAMIIAGWQILAPKFNYHPPQTKVASALKPLKKLQNFTLQDTNGNAFTAQSLRGHWTLLFFGYTACPDICPKTLGILRDAWSLYTAKQLPIPVRFVFADISPQPIASYDLKQFLHNYRSEFSGISGTPKQMQQLSDQLGIYSQQKDNRLDHTAALMLIDPQGRLHAVFTPPFSAEDLVDDLSILTT